MRFLWIITFLSAALAQTPFSGPQPGEPIPGLRVLMVNTDDAGREIDFVAKHGNAPLLIVFLHQLDRNVAALMTPTERFSQDRAAAGLRTIWLYLAPDKVEGERRMQAVAKSLKLQSAVGVSVDGQEGPGAYGLNKQVAITAIAGRDRKVTANYAIVQPGMVDAPKLLADVAKLVGGKVPTLEELQTGRMRPIEMQPADPPELVTLLRALIQKTNTGAQVDQAVSGIREWAGSHASRRAMVAKKMETLIPLKYGTDYAQSRMAALKAEMSQ